MHEQIYLLRNNQINFLPVSLIWRDENHILIVSVFSEDGLHDLISTEIYVGASFTRFIRDGCVYLI